MLKKSFIASLAAVAAMGFGVTNALADTSETVTLTDFTVQSTSFTDTFTNAVFSDSWASVYPVVNTALSTFGATLTDDTTHSLVSIFLNSPSATSGGSNNVVLKVGDKYTIAASELSIAPFKVNNFTASVTGATVGGGPLPAPAPVAGVGFPALIGALALLVWRRRKSPVA